MEAQFNMNKIVKEALGKTLIEMGFAKKNNIWFKLVNNEVILLLVIFSYQRSIIGRFYIQPLSFPLCLGNCKDINGLSFDIESMYIWKNNIINTNTPDFWIYNGVSCYDKAKTSINKFFQDAVYPYFIKCVDLRSSYVQFMRYYKIIEETTVITGERNEYSANDIITIHMLLELKEYTEARKYIQVAGNFKYELIELKYIQGYITKDQYKENVKELYNNLIFLIEAIDNMEYTRIDNYLENNYDKSRKEIFDILKIELPEWEERHRDDIIE